MAEIQVPDLDITGNKKVSTARGDVTNAGFAVAVVTEAGGTSTSINNAVVLKQEPTPQAKLTAGEVMHLYIAGSGPPEETTPIGASTKNLVIVIQFVVIVAFAVYCLVLGN
jgi:hypothetical protein